MKITAQRNSMTARTLAASSVWKTSINDEVYWNVAQVGLRGPRYRSCDAVTLTRNLDEHERRTDSSHASNRPRRRLQHVALRVQERFLANLKSGGTLFTTDATGLFQSYLEALPTADRQSHLCDACRRFLEVFGGLVTIDAKGVTRRAVWHGLNAPDYYAPAVAALERVVRRARVMGVFVSSLEVWGKPVTGKWRHLAFNRLLRPFTNRGC